MKEIGCVEDSHGQSLFNIYIALYGMNFVSSQCYLREIYLLTLK